VESHPDDRMNDPGLAQMSEIPNEAIQLAA
jgi:hypothetical protein